jgi:hypothetical protein
MGWRGVAPPIVPVLPEVLVEVVEDSVVAAGSAVLPLLFEPLSLVL